MSGHGSAHISTCVRSARKQKWRGVAQRYPGMHPDEQQRLQQQMQSWAQLTPEQRKVAREQYKSLKALPPDKKEEVRQKWEELNAAWKRWQLKKEKA